MIRWLVQTSVALPDLAAGHPPPRLLTAAEHAHFATYTNPRRRRDWLLGRWTSKQLVQAHIAARDGYQPAFDSFSIASGATGAPYVSSRHPALRGVGIDGCLPLALSISHSQGYAFCALCENRCGDVRLGVDIELISSKIEEVAHAFFTPAEKAKLQAAQPAARALLATLLWSAKEAVLKATHLGLTVDTQGVESLVNASRLWNMRHWTRAQVKLDPSLYSKAAYPQNEFEGPLALWWRVIENRLQPGASFVLTMAAFGATL
jgi:phosphopantetheine--protein transferase-like protein